MRDTRADGAGDGLGNGPRSGAAEGRPLERIADVLQTMSIDPGRYPPAALMQKLQRRMRKFGDVSLDVYALRVAADTGEARALARALTRSTSRRTSSAAIEQDTIQSLESYRRIFAASRQPGLIIAADGRIIESNRAAQHHFAKHFANSTPPALADLLAAEHAAGLQENLRAAAANEEIDLALTLVDGALARLHLSQIASTPEVLIYAQLIPTESDVRLRQRFDRALQLMQTTLSTLSEGIIVLDPAGKVLELNKMAERLTGWTREEALKQPYARVFRLQTAIGPLAEAHPIDAVLAGTAMTDDRNDLYLRHRDGRRFVLRLRMRSTPEGPSGAVLVFDDVSEMNLLTEELAYRASHDSLTGLLNRAEFETRARAVVAGAAPDGVTAVLCYIDIDQFKVINDTLGHAAGDELLHELAGELRSRVPEHDAFARLGGDEFGLLLSGHDLNSARGIADSLIDTARRFRFAWQGHTYAITISIGAALIDREASDITRAMSMADAACFVAKDAGRDRVLFAGNDDELASRHVQMSMVGKIGKSLDEDRFVLHYEDVVPIAAPTQVVYRELLVRMREPGGGLLAPSSFIQAAERYFLMGALDRWVLRNAFRGIAQLPEDGVIYAVNLSGQSLGDQKLLEFVLAELDRSGVNPERICFEITETAAVSRLTEAVRFISRISQCGCRFALDDFGSGMASFSYLKNFTVHFLKIDGSFVRAMLASRTDRGMVESINRIGHELGLKTIAEHVETPAMMEPLREMGVDWVQGRAIAWSKPFDTLLR